MSEVGTNQLWAGALIDELARAGVRHVCIAPGSRSTPLVFAAARHADLRTHVHLDERCAAFFALGLGRATGRPAAVITTSGTATANLFPAVIEASQAEVPLLILTADRPASLRGADANQAIDQVRLYGGYPRWSVECPHPEASDRALRHLRQMGSRAVAAALDPIPGPVHLNLPFAKPLEPTAGPGQASTPSQSMGGGAPGGRADGQPYTHILPGRSTPGEEALDVLARAVSASSRPLLIAGPASDPRRNARAVGRALSIADFAVLADPLSGVRSARALPSPSVAAYDLFLGRPRVRDALAPDLVVRVGASPTSQRVLDWLEELDVPQVVIDPGGRWKDHSAVASTMVRADPLLAFEGVAATLGATLEHPDWLGRWRLADTAARTAIQAALEEGPFEGGVAHDLAAALPEGATLFVSNSMPIRDVDAYVLPAARDLQILGNRGASGIDGIVSTALGVAAGSGGPCAALIGDLAFYHDMNGLLAAREHGLQIVFVLVNNDGGGIFHRLPVRGLEPEFTRYFATPHGLDFRHAAALYDVPFASVDPVACGSAVREALAAGGVRVLEVRTDREENHQRQRRVAETVQDAVERALNHENPRDR